MTKMVLAGVPALAAEMGLKNIRLMVVSQRADLGAKEVLVSYSQKRIHFTYVGGPAFQ